MIEFLKKVGRGIDAAFQFVARQYDNYPKISLGVTVAVFVLSHWLRG